MVTTELSPALPSVRKLFTEGRWHADLGNEAKSLTHSINNYASWLTYLDIRHNLTGFSVSEWETLVTNSSHCIQNSQTLFFKLAYLMISSDNFNELSKNERLTYLRLLGSNRHSKWFSQHCSLWAPGKLGSRIRHYPELLRIPDDEQLIQFGYSSLPSSLVNKSVVLEHLTVPINHLFVRERRINQKNAGNTASTKIAVVGNSPNLLTGNRGRQIDSSDVVIRFNNTGVNFQNAKHTGKRTDIWVMSPSIPVTHCPCDADSIVVSGLHSLTRPSLYWRTLPDMNKQLAEFPCAIWYELVKCFNAPPSAGALLLASLESMALDATICCYGFTATPTDLDTYTNHYADTTKRSSRHNWLAEIRWLADKLAKSERFVVAG